MSRTIRVDEETYTALTRLKSDDETFDDLISRLLRRRRASVREGAGLWSESDAAEKAREARDRMKRDADLL